MQAIAILDFGSQYTQLIARRVRELHVYCEIFPWDAPAQQVTALEPSGFILSGGPASIYDPGAPQIPPYVFESAKPILGICYGMQALTQALGGRVSPSNRREYGMAHIRIVQETPLLPQTPGQVWMSHGDRIEQIPPGFVRLAETDESPFAALGDMKRNYYGLQFHPEVRHTIGGQEMLWRFVLDICRVKPQWTPDSIISQTVEKILAVTDKHQERPVVAISAISGGVDSAVATALAAKALGKKLAAVFVDTGLLRQNERQQVEKTLGDHLGIQLSVVDAAGDYLEALHGVVAPEEKRRIIGERFIRIFEKEAKKFSMPPFLVQGTIYPDVVESSAPERNKAARIKTHHNVGGLPSEMHFELIEPLRYLFKDEVRLVGEALGLPAEMVWRQPFPGPGLAVRCLGEINATRLEILRAADAIFIEELTKANLLRFRGNQEERSGTSQAFAVLLPVRSVGVMGDNRTYDETVALRAVTTEDFMTADWAHLPLDLLGRVSNRIVNEVEGVNRVVYDITSKPPATIEWE